MALDSMFLYGLATGVTATCLFAIIIIMSYKKVHGDETPDIQQSHPMIAQEYIEPRLSLESESGMWYIQAILGNTVFTRDIDADIVETIMLASMAKSIGPYRDNILFDMRASNGEKYTVEIIKKVKLE